jgi:general secretion pathway protein I
LYPLPRFNPRASDRGFTLVELLIALAVVAVLLAAIGSVVASTARAARSLDNKLALVQTARAISTGLPDRQQLALGNSSGQLAAHRWRLDVQPFIASFIDTRRPGPWVPQNILITVQSPTGQTTQLQTVRLRRAEQEAR